MIIPTISRPTLARTLASIRAQRLIRGDEVLLVPDGLQPIAEELWAQCGLPGRVLCLGMPAKRNEGTLRDRAMPRARADWLCFMDDDDQYSPGAFDVIRQAVAGTDGLHIFRQRYPNGDVRWQDVQQILFGNVGTLGLVVTRRGPLGKWSGEGPGTDFRFAQSTAAANGGLVHWHEDVIALVRPHDPGHKPGPPAFVPEAPA